MAGALCTLTPTTTPTTDTTASPALPAMDADLIKLVNKLQDTFANLGACPRSSLLPAAAHVRPGGELDMPQLAVVRVLLPCGPW